MLDNAQYLLKKLLAKLSLDCAREIVAINENIPERKLNLQETQQIIYKNLCSALIE